MTVTAWDLAKAVGLAIVQINAVTLAVNMVAGPLFMLWDIWQDWSNNAR